MPAKFEVVLRIWNETAKPRTWVYRRSKFPRKVSESRALKLSNHMAKILDELSATETLVLTHLWACGGTPSLRRIVGNNRPQVPDPAFNTGIQVTKSHSKSSSADSKRCTYAPAVPHEEFRHLRVNNSILSMSCEPRPSKRE